MGVQIAKAMGFRVIGIDGGDEKKALCMKLGCEFFVDFTKTEDVVTEVIRITGGLGAHGVFVTATSAAAYKAAPMMVRVGGRVMCIGLSEFSYSIMLWGGIQELADIASQLLPVLPRLVQTLDGLSSRISTSLEPWLAPCEIPMLRWISLHE